ncbi:hypothetical protein AB1K91_01015 [Terribacillus sp. 179-K 1B1 HS]|uniref:hypothetical protein n=1 Tax=Terribacillus sp. 179-K 1B1 HS TaxID=3142388 RepID=UPI0039A31E3B
MLDMLINVIQLILLYWKQGVPGEVLFVWMPMPFLLMVSELITRRVLKQPLHRASAYVKLLGTCIVLSGAWIALLPGLLHIAGKLQLISITFFLDEAVLLAGISLAIAACLLPLSVIWIKIKHRVMKYFYVVMCGLIYTMSLHFAAVTETEVPLVINILLGLAFCMLAVAVPNLDYTDEQTTHRLKGQHT